MALLVLSVIPAGAGDSDTVASGRGDLRVSLIKGPVFLLTRGSFEWVPLVEGALLKEGDRVRTGRDARLEILLPDSTILRFADQTHFHVALFDVLAQSEQGNVKIKLVLGRIWANVRKKLGIASSFEVSSEHAIAGVRGTIYRMNVYDDTSVLVRTYDGEVYVKEGEGRIEEPAPSTGPPTRIAGPSRIPGPRKVSMEEWLYIIKSMQQIVVNADGTPGVPRAFDEAEDRNEWVDWNKKRDNIVWDG